MLLIYCPYCETHRGEEEFSYQGEAFLTRPSAPDSLSDEEWGDYLYFRKNPRGLHAEVWFHMAGCRRFFNALRNTVTCEFQQTCRIGDSFSDNSDAHV